MWHPFTILSIKILWTRNTGRKQLRKSWHMGNRKYEVFVRGNFKQVSGTSEGKYGHLVWSVSCYFKAVCKLNIDNSCLGLIVLFYWRFLKIYYPPRMWPHCQYTELLGGNTLLRCVRYSRDSVPPPPTWPLSPSSSYRYTVTPPWSAAGYLSILWHYVHFPNGKNNYVRQFPIFKFLCLPTLMLET